MNFRGTKHAAYLKYESGKESRGASVGPSTTEPCSITLTPDACWPVTMECLHPGFPQLFPLLALLPGVRGGRDEEGEEQRIFVRAGSRDNRDDELLPESSEP